MKQCGIPNSQCLSFSFAVLRVEVSALTGSKLSGHATGFILRWKDERYFVTNKHVVTQSNFFTNRPLRNDFCGLPGKLHAETAMTISRQPAALSGMAKWPDMLKSIGSMPVIELPVSDEEGNLDPGWVLSGEADVAAYRLDEAHGAKSFGKITFGPGCFEGAQINERVTARAMADCFIIGFPELGQLYQGMMSPIYKRASLAVEPELCVNLPLLVDGKTKPGMSGSPVIFRCENCGEWHLLGVYSGRESADPDLTNAELGMVWGFKRHIRPVIDSFLPRIAKDANGDSN